MVLIVRWPLPDMENKIKLALFLNPLCYVPMPSRQFYVTISVSKNVSEQVEMFQRRFENHLSAS